MAESTRASVMAIKEESTAGTLIQPSAATNFIPLRAGFSMTPAVEELSSDELLAGSLGSAKSFAGRENPAGSHPIYFKHSQVEGTAPNWGLLLKSALGAESIALSEYLTTVASTISLLKLASGGSTFSKGQAVLVKDGTNGYAIRNVTGIATNDLSINYNLSGAPATGLGTGKAVLYKPATSGHPTFSAWVYMANGGAIQAISGCRVNSVTMNLNAGSMAEGTIEYSGTQFYFNPITISAANHSLDFTDDGGTVAATLSHKTYKSPMDLAVEIQTKMNAISTGGDPITCTYSSTTGKFTIAAPAATVFSLLWNTGANTATSCGAAIGFSLAADDTLALTYASDSALTYAAPFTPDYDDADNIIVKSAELFIGTATDNFCRKASSVSVTVNTPTADVTSICAETGLYERVPSKREVSVTATILLEKHEVGLFDKFINNTGSQLMCNIGPKVNGNWVAGKCMNIYFGNASISSLKVGGDEFVTMEVTAKGYVTSSLEDVYINFV
jgi:hypothetical protein